MASQEDEPLLSLTRQDIAACALALVWVSALTGCGALQSPSPAGSHQSGSAPTATPSRSNAQPVAAKLRRISGPKGDYEIAAPDGWLLDRVQNENPIEVVSSQNSGFRVGIAGMLWINEFAATPCWQQVTDVIKALQCDAAYGAGQMSAADALPVIISLAEQAQPGEQVKIVSAPSPRQGNNSETTVSVTYQGADTEQVWIVSMLYVLNPLYTGISWANGSQQTYWDSFAFVSACSAPNGHLRDVLQLCAAIVMTFQPHGWLQAEILSDVNFRHQQVQLVLKALGNPNDIPLDNYKQQLTDDASNRSVWRNWYNALGGTVELEDANGDYYQVEDKYHYYCLTSHGPVGYDNVPPADCDSELRRVSPP